LPPSNTECHSRHPRWDEQNITHQSAGLALKSGRPAWGYSGLVLPKLQSGGAAASNPKLRIVKIVIDPDKLGSTFLL
jgi:hypothetical protein